MSGNLGKKLIHINHFESYKEHSSVYISAFQDQDVVTQCADGKMMWSLSYWAYERHPLESTSVLGEDQGTGTIMGVTREPFPLPFTTSRISCLGVYFLFLKITAAVLLLNPLEWLSVLTSKIRALFSEVELHFSSQWETPSSRKKDYLFLSMKKRINAAPCLLLPSLCAQENVYLWNRSSANLLVFPSQSRARRRVSTGQKGPAEAGKLPGVGGLYLQESREDKILFGN